MANAPKSDLAPHTAAMNALTDALKENTKATKAHTVALVGASFDAHAIVYAVMKYPSSANQTKTDAINISDTPFAKTPEALTDELNRALAATGSKKAVTLQAIANCKTVGDVVKAL